MAKERDESKKSAKSAIFRAILVRFLFLVHSVFVIWRVADVAGLYWWLLLVVNVMLIAEGVYIVVRRNGREYKWVCLCILLYLGSTVPGIFILELNRVDRFEELASNNESVKEELSDINGITIPIRFAADTWVDVIEQSLLFLVVLGRWILPRGRISRTELSTLLFVYIGIVSDILDIFQLFDEPEVRNDRALTYATLGAFIASLLPFTLVLTAVRKRDTGSQNWQKSNKCCDRCILVDTELWSLLVYILLQDGPFLAIRLWAIIKYKLFVSSIFFFTFKNILFIASLFYRAIVICQERNRTPEEDAQTLELNDNYRDRRHDVKERTRLTDGRV